MPKTFTGGCVCGAVRYEGSADPVFTGNCHCRDCQRATGGPFASLLAVPKAALKTTGEVSYYDFKAESGNTVSRGFCRKCGSRLMGRSTMFDDLVVIMAGSLDDPSWYKPAMDLWTASAQPWDHMSPELPQFPKNPPMG